MICELVASALAMAGINGPVTVECPAVRIEVPIEVVVDVPPPIAGRCTQYEAALAATGAHWDVIRMSRIMHRESRCEPHAWNRRGRAAGLLQVTPITYDFLARQLGGPITAQRLFDPDFNIRAAAALFGEDGYNPWRLG